MVEVKTQHVDGKFEFRHQRDLAYHNLLECGIGQELSSSGFCWAASTDMALSPFVPRTIRMQIVLDAAQELNHDPEAFGPKGNLNLSKLGQYVNAVNSQLDRQMLDARLKLIEQPKLTDYHEEVLKGNTVIFTEGESQLKHLMVIDGIQQDGGVVYFSAWNPDIERPDRAQKYFQNLDMERMELYPAIISVGESLKN